MFDVAPTEMLVVAIIALLVIGPKDLPKAMRFVGKWVGKARGMARHFRSGLDTMMREAELEDLEKQWRAHNESIMRAYPDVASPMTPAAPGELPAPVAAAATAAAATPAATTVVGPPAPPPATAPDSPYGPPLGPARPDGLPDTAGATPATGSAA